MKRTRAYKILTSIGHEINIDEEELPGIIAAIAAKKDILAKQGVVNPAHYVCIVEDEKRTKEWEDLCKDRKNKLDEHIRMRGEIAYNEGIQSLEEVITEDVLPQLQQGIKELKGKQ